MSNSETLEQQALNLNEQERVHLILKLLESLEPADSEYEVMGAWAEEAGLRYQAWKDGKMKTVSEEEFRKEVRKKFKK
jgi:putative addiction module component (TIGR02574 family)